ncbi:pilus assembly protein TadG [Phenylobacterium aquaticum]|uniref:pilus assembly protein TadG n=1 Tax=Phenylobacterium aquaticum TaxID=1763816 RepID=UPI0026E9AF12|nr:pilus assembly protein TadG [Phenylobacterium aquaticum]
MRRVSNSPNKPGRRKALLGWLRAGARDERGAAAVFFAVAMILLAPIVLGMADIYLGSTQRTQLQDALDAATLFAARSSANTTPAVDAVGDKALSANLVLPSGVTLVSSTFTLSGDTVTGYAEITAPAIAPGVWPHANITANAKVVRSLDRLEVALVLDNTGSMAGTKLTNTKTAADNLIDTLVTAAAQSTLTDPLKVSLVPFSMTVRVQNTTSLTNYNTTTHAGTGIPTWLDPEAKAEVAAGTDNFDVQTDRFKMMKQMGLSWAGCVESRQQPYDIQETAPTTGTAATMFVPYFWPDEPDSSAGYWGYQNDYRPDGTTSNSWLTRQRNSAKYTAAPTSGDGPNQDCDMQPLIRLTTATASVKTAIDAMVATGETNVPMGLMWGWHTLSPNAPFADGAAYTSTHLRKIIILMTDGDNTYTNPSNSNGNLSSYEGLGYIWQNLLGVTSASDSTRTTKMNARFTALCANVKAQGITIYAVGVQVSSGSKALLQSCATSSDKYYDVTAASDLNAAFAAIAGSINALRISH